MAAAVEVSWMVTEAERPCTRRRRTSDPSVRLSARIGIEIVATPLAFNMANPLSEPPATSAALIPERV